MFFLCTLLSSAAGWTLLYVISPLGAFFGVGLVGIVVVIWAAAAVR